MDIEHDRPPAAIVHRRRPDIEHQAVFAAGGLMLAESGARSLHRGRSEASSVAHACPGRHGGRLFEAVPAGNRSGVWNALEGQRSTAMAAADTSAIDRDLDEG